MISSGVFPSLDGHLFSILRLQGQNTQLYQLSFQQFSQCCTLDATGWRSSGVPMKVHKTWKLLNFQSSISLAPQNYALRRILKIGDFSDAS